MTSLSVKPHLLRADTIDLQPQQNPSAKDHTRGQYGHTYSNSANSLQPGGHHTQALRNANHDAYQEMQSSPRLGGFDHTTGPNGQMHMYDDGDDEEEDDHMNNGINGNGDGSYHDGNDSQDEDMDDELLDKISSSPSIEDGKHSWPPRADSLRYGLLPGPGAVPTRGISFSPINSTHISPTQLPAKTSPGNHQSGQSARKDLCAKSLDFSRFPRLSPNASPDKVDPKIIPYSSSMDDITRHLLPIDDPFLDDLAHEDLAYLDFDDQDPEWVDEEIDQDSDSSDDDSDNFVFTSDPRFLDSGWGGECLRELEDIDFEFVYALHTFVATVEGQANATKGDTMVLLDDSNSYWWLVRVVKDGSIGYLPAEHIETPTERLARLNKHRNIDLAATMLGDNPEKSKNPLKKAMRRRNAKNVNFAPPTYYDADPRVWSDDEDEEEEGEEGEVVHVENNTAQQEQQEQQEQQAQQQQQQQQQVQNTQQNQQAQSGQQIVQSNESQRVQPVAATIHRVDSIDDTEEEEPSSPVKSNQGQILTPNDSQENVRKTKTGVVRNTDSFYRDDSVETKKISLTPQLLRNDTDPTSSTDHEVKRRTSPDTFDKVIGEDKSKDGKKKEKKGMLSGLFKRKDKSGKGARSDTDETDRMSEDSGRSPQSKDSIDDTTTPDRKTGKLQKNPQSVASPKQSPTEARALHREPSLNTSQQPGVTPGQKSLNETAQVSQQLSQSTPNSTQQPQPQQSQQQAQTQAPGRFPSLQEKRSVFAPITGALRSKNSSQDMGDSVKPIYSKRAKERFAIDESDTEDDSTPTAQSSILHRSISPSDNSVMGNGRPDSDMGVSPLETHDQTKMVSAVPMVATDVKERPGPSQQTNSTASPTTPSDQTASTSKHSPSVAGHTPSTSRSTPTWSDSSLRSYMENDQDIRDLLVIVHDKTNVMPVGSEHPLMNGLFASERTKLADMQSQLDSMLMSWLSKKRQPMGSGVVTKV